jgi:hypothetical protein
MTRKFLFFVFIFVLIIQSVFAQSPGETIFQSYERIFVRSSLSTKVNVLSDAANDEAAAEFYGPFCSLALRFVIDNASLFRDDPDMINITIAAVRGLGDYAYRPATETVWQAFLRFPDKVIRYEILKVLPVLDTLSLTGKINDFISEQNRRFNSGMTADTELLMPLFSVLGGNGDVSSYPVLLNSSIIYSGELREEITGAFYKINGNIFDFCINVIINNEPEEKLAAFRLLLGWAELGGEEKCLLAEAALDAALSLPYDMLRPEIKELSEASLVIIRESGWIRALPQVLKYYNQSLARFRESLSFKQPLINAIQCLGNLKSAGAAQTLTLQLGLYNSRSELFQPEELEVVLATINALGQLAYKASYDALHYASILPYPARIVEGAENALAKLKW